MTLRIGLIGAGANTRLQPIPGFQGIDGVEITAVCNRSRESGQKVADEYGISQVFENWQELIQSDEVDAICIGTWPYMHCPMTLAGLEAGVHVLTEARMCMNLTEARQMYEASQQSDKVAMIVPAPFYLLAEPILLDKLQSDFFGDLLEITSTAWGAVTIRRRRCTGGSAVNSRATISWGWVFSTRRCVATRAMSSRFRPTARPLPPSGSTRPLAPKLRLMSSKAWGLSPSWRAGPPPSIT